MLTLAGGGKFQAKANDSPVQVLQRSWIRKNMLDQKTEGRSMPGKKRLMGTCQCPRPVLVGGHLLTTWPASNAALPPASMGPFQKCCLPAVAHVLGSYAQRRLRGEMLGWVSVTPPREQCWLHLHKML